MKCTGIHQLLPNLCAGDAISDYAIVLRDTWRAWGLRSTIFAGNVGSARIGDAEPIRRIGDFASTEVLVYHLSTGNDLADLFASSQVGARFLFYHNITPPSLLLSVPEMAARSQRGLAQLRELAGVTDLAIADSRFNARDLVVAGYRACEVLPLALSRARTKALQAMAERRQPQPGEPPVILHVGRVLPHKRIERAIATYEFLLAACPAAASARLRIVGDCSEAPRYAEGLRDLATAHHLDGVEVTGKISEAALMAQYGRADAYLCMSAHEGFCVPLLESMFAGVPVVAVASGAVPELLDGAGLVFEESDPALCAEALCRVLTDPAARSTVVAAQFRRAECFTQAALDARLRDLFLRHLPGI